MPMVRPPDPNRRNLRSAANKATRRNFLNLNRILRIGVYGIVGVAEKQESSFQGKKTTTGKALRPKR